MQREIKFRGKRVDSGEWVYGSLLADLLDRCFIVADQGTWRTYDEVNPETLGQFTGLQDKNGKEIYEGDILFKSLPVERTRIVYFENGCFSVENTPTDRTLMFNSFPIGKGERWEITGNIYENTELMN